MSLINHKELIRQLQTGEITSLDDVAKEFKNIMRDVIQTASEEELSAHLGYQKHQLSHKDNNNNDNNNNDNNNPNYRNGHNKKTLKSKYGNLDVAIPRDRQGSFEPQLVQKREVILNGSEDLILSLYTKGMSVRDIQHHLDDLYGYELSTTTISNITEKIMVKVDEWQHRPLESIYAVIFMDATVLKIKIDGSVKNIAIYIMLGITIEGKKEIIGFWVGENETAKYWLTVLNDIKKRGVNDVLIFAIDGLNGFSQAIEALYPQAEVQRCIVHQIRSSLRFVSWKDRKAVAKDLKSIYTALNEEQAQTNLDEFKDIWDKKYPNISKSWQNNWGELSTFFKYPDSVRTLIYTTNPIESLNAIIKKKTKSKGSFPTTGSAMKMVFLATQQIQEKWQRSKVRNWSEIYPQLCIFFDEVMGKYEK